MGRLILFKKLPYASAEAMRAAYDFDDLSSFLAQYYEGMSVLLDEADFQRRGVKYLYADATHLHFMDNENYEQYELTLDQMDDAWKYLKEGMNCQMVLYNGNPITMTPPNHVELKVEYCEPGAKGDTATNVTKPCKMETGAEINCPAFVEMGELVKVDTRTGEYIERVKE